MTYAFIFIVVLSCPFMQSFVGYVGGCGHWGRDQGPLDGQDVVHVLITAIKYKRWLRCHDICQCQR